MKTGKLKFTLLACLLGALLLFNASELRGNGEEIHFYKNVKINDVFYIDLVENVSAGDSVVISSTGGEIKVAIDLVNYLNENQVHLRLRDFCLSACADILLPAVRNVELSDNLFIAFHGNARIYNALYSQANGDNSHDCFLSAANAEHDIIKANGSNSEFWKTQIEKLEPLRVSLIKGDDECDFINYVFKYDFWIPTSNDLQILLNKEISEEMHINSEEWARKHFTRLRVSSAIYGDGVSFIR